MNPKSLLNPMRCDAISIFNAGIAAVESREAVLKNVHLSDNQLRIGKQSYNLLQIKNIFVIGAGKATAKMATAIESLLGDRIKAGLITVKYDHGCPLKIIKTVEAGHPVPDRNGEKGAQAILELAHLTKKEDLVINLISGGGSALLPSPINGLTLQDKQETSRILLACGAGIDEINIIRKHMSAIKGGHLAQAVYPATLVSLILSDVVGDDPQVIGSGPTAPDLSTYQDCNHIIQKYQITKTLPKAVLDYIQGGLSGKNPETPKEEDPIFKNVYNFIIGSNTSAMRAARNKAREIGYNTIILSSSIQGETRDIADMHTAIAKEILKTGNPIETPACVLSGGETTVTIKGNGLGGRNQEFALKSAMEISNQDYIVVLSGGTDGTDGPTDAAGALADSKTFSRALEKGLVPANYLADNNSYHFFKALDDLLITGPTKTNVMDLRIMIIRAET